MTPGAVVVCDFYTALIALARSHPDAKRKAMHMPQSLTD